MRILALTLSCAAFALTTPAVAHEAPANPQIDYDGFVELAIELAEVRKKHRLSLEEFLKQARAEGRSCSTHAAQPPLPRVTWKAQ